MGAVAYWSRRAARLHSSIRGLSPQAGGFRRRSNRASSVCRVTGIAHDPYERLPCVQQVVTSHLLFRIILQYAAVFQPRVLFLFRGTRNILPTEMALCYKNLWKLLIDRDMTRKDLHRVSGVSHATLAKMSRGESVTASVLDRICNSLDCRIENVMEITPDKPCEVNRRRAQNENGGAQLKRGMK